MKPPFFLIGAQRSGTTMLRLMLNAHPAIAVPFESDFIPELSRRSDEFGDLRIRSNAEAALQAISANRFVSRGHLVTDPNQILAHEIESFSDLVRAVFLEYARSQGKTRWGDKTPSYLTELDLLGRLFPEARFVHLVRDGRDVALSLRRVSWGKNDLPWVATDWRWRTTLAHKVGAVLGDRFLEIRYEDLVRDPQRVLEEVCRFLDETFEPEMLLYHGAAESQMPEDSLQWHRSSVSAPDPSMASRWREEMSPPDQVIFERAAGPALDLFGYDRTSVERTFLLRLRTRLRTIRYALYAR